MTCVVGFRNGVCFDETRLNWDGTGFRPLAWSAWYPADEGVSACFPTGASWFQLRPVASNAPLAPSVEPFPLVLLSHGSGGVAAGMEWLAHRLAQRGYIALAVDHHGHTGSEPYRAEGFLCLWERARDLSALIGDLSWRHALGGAVDDRACVAGFSAGAYTAMLLLMGARIAYSQFEPDNPVKSPIRGPREFPDLAGELPGLFDNPVFRQSWECRRDDCSDRRFLRAVAIAPGRSALGFTADSLQAIRRPVQIFGGDADTVAPATECCEWLARNVPSGTVEILSGGIGHYTFLPEGSETGIRAAPELFSDKRGVQRSAIHDYVADRAVEFFGQAS